MKHFANLVEETPPQETNLTVGVLALQGAFLEHINVLRRLGVEAKPIRKPEELADLDGLIIPGGESTTIGKLVVRWGFIDPLKQFVTEGKPVWGTCAGMILLAEDIGQTPEIGGAHIIPPRLGVMDIKVDRNAYGRQVDSFEADLAVDFLEDATPFPAVFIRAPRIEAVGDGITPLIYHEEKIVAALQDNQLLVTAFHPELTGDNRMHAYFVSLIQHRN
ncbi:MAG: pyridoxal 5'-phosphate synthase glutaminase subunit PdxT [Chloroflexota bacterium]